MTTAQSEIIAFLLRNRICVSDFYDTISVPGAVMASGRKFTLSEDGASILQDGKKVVGVRSGGFWKVSPLSYYTR